MIHKNSVGSVLCAPLCASLVLLLGLLVLPATPASAATPGPSSTPGAGSCSPSETVLCLQRGRFAVSLDWQSFAGGGQGIARPVTDHSGAFWLFDPDNLEVGVKIEDRRTVNGFFAVFLGSLTDAELTLTVTDTATGEIRVYTKPLAVLTSFADLEAFAGNRGPNSTLAPSTLAPSVIELPETEPASPVTVRSSEATSTASGCSPISLCLLDDRFQVRVTWTGSQGLERRGLPVALNPTTGAFWFQRPADLEVLVKILDGRALNGNFWVAFAALTEQGFEIEVTDTETGAVVVYNSPPGTFPSVIDTSAFPDSP